MSARLGAEDKLRLDARITLLNKLEVIAVERWPEPISMRTIIERVVPDATKYIVDASRAEDRWHQAVRKLELHNKLPDFIDAVQDELGEADEDLTELRRLENERLEEAKLKLRSKAMESFDRLVEGLAFTTEYIKQLREPENLDLVELAAIRDKLHSFYEQLDKLREAQRAAALRRSDEIAQASSMETQANKCTDALQLYRKLVEYSNSTDDHTQTGVTGGPGGLSHWESDEAVLIRAKVGLRNALIRLGKAGGII